MNRHRNPRGNGDLRHAWSGPIYAFLSCVSTFVLIHVRSSRYSSDFCTAVRNANMVGLSIIFVSHPPGHMDPAAPNQYQTTWAHFSGLRIIKFKLGFAHHSVHNEVVTRPRCIKFMVSLIARSGLLPKNWRNSQTFHWFLFCFVTFHVYSHQQWRM